MPGELDMRRMQEEAARRAREMQSRARAPQPRHSPPRPPQEAPPPPPPEPPPEPPKAPPPEAGTPAPAPASWLEGLLKDKERTIILALLVLLGNEGANQELLFALLFLLM